MPLTPEQVNLLLQEEASQPSRTRKSKVDPTLDRSVAGWFKLGHHFCTPDCPHRIDPNNPTAHQEEAEDGGIVWTPGNACWNPNCMDQQRNKESDRGTNIVYEVKGQYICRFCYLGGYLT